MLRVAAGFLAGVGVTIMMHRILNMAASARHLFDHLRRCPHAH